MNLNTPADAKVICKSCLCAFGVAAAFLFTSVAEPLRWVEDSFEEFADGKLDGAGNNLYVSRDGTVRTIHRFDFNGDGFIDLPFNSTHDNRPYVPATVGSVDISRTITETSVAALGTQRIAAGDLNKDGFVDLVFLRSSSGIQSGRSMLNIVYGGTDGWPAHRSTGALPEPQYTTDVALPDLNADGWLDVVIIAAGPKPALYVYWGSELGYSTARRLECVAPPEPRGAAADLDGDGFADLVIASLGKVAVHWATPEAKELPQPTETKGPFGAPRCLAINRKRLTLASGDEGIFAMDIEALRQIGEVTKLDIAATHVSTGDLDGDGFIDLVTTNFSIIRAAGGEAGAAKESNQGLSILWGDSTGRFDVNRSSKLPAKHATSTAIGDADGDGTNDLAVAIYQGEESFEGKSLVFFGQSARQFVQSEGGFNTQAPLHVVMVRGSDGKQNIIFANSQGGTLGEKVPLDIFWGGLDGFSPGRKMQLPFASGSESDAADFNNDGFVDLVFTYSGHGGQTAATDDQVGTHIFWGSADGFSEKRRTVLREDKIWTVTQADLNRDGYLDLITCAESAIDPAKPACLFIYHGSAEGFSNDRRTAIPVGKRATAGHAADFNNDGWLDLVTTDWFEHKVTILFGSAEGYAPGRSKVLEVDRPVAAEVADWNKDGFLDLAIGRFSDAAGENFDMGLFIFWGSDKGFTHANAQWLPGLTPTDLTAADWDGDGYLDLFASDYHATMMRESIPSYLFWGGKDGFRTDRKTRITADSASGALAGDFDRDGKLDLAISCHTQHGNHRTESLIIYNDGRRFENVVKVQKLPTVGSHWMDMHDMGHIADRKWQQKYESSVFQFNSPHRQGQITCDAEMPTGTSMPLEIRSAPTRDELANASWRETAKAGFSLHDKDRFLQYRATLTSDNGDRYPALNRMTIELTE